MIPYDDQRADVLSTSYADWTSVNTDEPQAQTPQFIQESEPAFKVLLSFVVVFWHSNCWNLHNKSYQAMEAHRDGMYFIENIFQSSVCKYIA